MGTCLDRPLGEIDVAGTLSRLLAIAARHGLVLPATLVALFKQIMYLEGVCRTVDPEFDLLGDGAAVVDGSRAEGTSTCVATPVWGSASACCRARSGGRRRFSRRSGQPVGGQVMAVRRLSGTRWRCSLPWFTAQFATRQEALETEPGERTWRKCPATTRWIRHPSRNRHRRNGHRLPRLPALDGSGRSDQSLATSLLSNPEFRQRFRAEAHLMTRFDSENLVNIYDYLEQDGGASYLVMQHVPGVSLRELIRSSGRLGPEQALEVLAGALSGLAAAHRLGVVHGDLKPENVIVTAEGTSKLIDFGQASPSGSRPSGGSPAYASPEAVRDEAVDARSDIYCAGLILYELLAGTPPFSGSAAEVLAAHQAETPTRLRDVPEGVANLVSAVAFEASRGPPGDSRGLPRRAGGCRHRFVRPALAGASLGRCLGGGTARLRGGHSDGRTRGGVCACHHHPVGMSGGVHGAPSGAHALRLSGGRSVFRWVRSARSVAAHHPIVSSVAAAAVITGAVVAATGATAPLASSWHLASASLAPGAVSCADATHCVALDGQNVIVIGADSKVQIAGLPAASGAVAGISCPSELRCWAVGSTTAGSGTILASSDGGLEWALEPVPSGVGALTAVGCAPHTTDCSALAGTTIIATADGGRWHLSPAPSNVGNYSHISCATTPDCVAAAGGSLVTTSDAGRTWLVVKQSWPELFGVSSLDCVSASVCWLTGNYQSSLMSVAGLVAVSADGGAVWETRALPAKPQLYGVDAISCVSRRGASPSAR